MYQLTTFSMHTHFGLLNNEHRVFWGYNEHRGFFWVQWTLGWCFNGSSPTKNPAFLLKQVGRTQAFLLTLLGTWAAICPQHNLHRIGPRADIELLGLTILSFYIYYLFFDFLKIYTAFFFCRSGLLSPVQLAVRAYRRMNRGLGVL